MVSCSTEIANSARDLSSEDEVEVMGMGIKNWESKDE